MQLNGTNKFEIFQDFYYVMNGVQISYSEALRLFAQMDAETAADFEKFYKDEVGYEIVVPNGFNLEPDLGSPKATGTKTVKRKQKKDDGSIEWVDKTVNTWTMGRTETLEDGTEVFIEHVSSTTKNNINTKYTLDAYAKKNGLVLDPQWAIYSAEEIITMADNGVNVPQEVVDIANTIMQSTVSSEQAIEGEDGQEDTTLSFLELIPLAEKKIEKCDKNNEKIEKEIQDLLPEQQKRKRKFDDQMKEQRRSLKEYEAFVREWNHIQTKINNGEALSTSEARRYADLMGMFEEKKSGDDKGFSLDKREIAKSMNELNILAILGEKLADETIVIGDTLADYTSKANYKTTRSQAQGEIGFLRAIIAMAQGKALAKEANITGNDTKDFTDETQQSVNDIASVLDIGGMIAGKDEVLGTEQPKTQEAGSEDAVQETEQQTAQGTESAQGEDKNPEITEQEDFVINDKNVKELIKEATDINVDLAQQTISAVKSIRVAKDDRKFAKIAGIKVTKLVKEFQKQEEERQARIQAMEQENKEANQELENLTGKSADELNEQKPAEKTQETDNEKVAELRQKIASNNEEIENIKVESEEATGKFATATEKESEIISKAIPAEAEALENDTEYKEEIIPVAKERLDFTDASGETLSKIGVYRIELGMMQIMAWQIEKGLKNIALGTISTGIGLAAQVVGDTPLPTIAEKATDKAVKEEDGAINDLTTLEAEIISVTGAEATQIPTSENEEGVETTENNEETTPAEGAEEDTETEGVEGEVSETTGEVVEEAGIEETVTEASNEEPTVDETVEEEPVVEETENTDNTESTEGTKKEEKEEDPDAVKEAGDKQEGVADKQQDIVDDTADSAKDDSKDSEKIKKNTEKDEKQLEKEAKRLEKEIQKEQEQVIKLTEVSQRAVEKQQAIMMEYETISAESEQLAAEEEAKKMSAPKQQPAQQQNGEEGGILASNSFTITSGGSDNQGKLEQNSQRINELGVEFKSQDTIVVRNRTKITNIQKSIKTKTKKFEKTTKLRTTKLKETEKKEKEKQKRLNKQLAIVGIAENVFSITSAVGTLSTLIGKGLIVTGTAMLSNPFTAAIGGALVSAGTWLEVHGDLLTTIGTYGTVACGLTKGIINIANGNLAAGLMAIGSAAISAVSAATGTGGAAASVFQQVSAGLQIVSSSAELANNVRVVQGKEASGVASKIATVAGVGSAVTGAADSVSNMGGQNTLGKIATITSATGTALSSTSQLMTEFGGDEKTASILGTIGGGLQTLGSIGQLANKKNSNESDNNEESEDQKTEKNKKSNKKDKTKKKDNKTEDNKNSESTSASTPNPEALNISTPDTDATKLVGKPGTPAEIAPANLSEAQAIEAADALRSENPAGNSNEIDTQNEVVEPVNTKSEALETDDIDDDFPIFSEDELNAEIEDDNQNSDIPKTPETPEEKAQREEEFRKTNMKENGASEEFADIDDDQLDEFRQDALGEYGEDSQEYKDIIAEQEKRAEFKKNKAKEAKREKINNILDITGQTANTAMAVAGMFMTQNQEGETKKKYAAPGKLTKRTKDIMKKNAKYRQRRVQALSRTQRYYA